MSDPATATVTAAPGGQAWEDLLRAMKRVARLFRDNGLPFALAGGLAVYARGGLSSDHDVDFLIRERDADGALALLAAAGLDTERPPEDWLVKAYDGGTLVDLIYRPVGRPVTDETLADVTDLSIGAVLVPVLSATELIVHRLLTFSEHSCDLSTALTIARMIREQVDWARVSAQTKESPYARAFLVVLDSLDLVPPHRTEAGG